MSKNPKTNYNDKGFTKRKWKDEVYKKKMNRIKNLEGCNGKQK